MNNEYFLNELMHYGIKRRSGRYPYGSGERPYQSGGGGNITKKIKSIKQKKEVSSSKRKAEDKKKHEEKKPEVLQKGSATDVKKYLGELSNQELQAVVQRLNLEKQVKEMSAKESKTNVQRIDNIMQTMKSIDNWAKIGTAMYNTIVSIYNITEEGRKRPMRRIS